MKIRCGSNQWATIEKLVTHINKIEDDLTHLKGQLILLQYNDPGDMPSVVEE